MRRWTFGVLSLAVALTACDKFAARSDVAAEVGDHQLKAERVAEILRRSGGGPTMQAAEFVSNLWFDYSLFADAVAKGAIKTDSATVAMVMWPDISQARVQLWHDSTLARLATISPDGPDSAYNDGTARVFQHIIAVPGGTTAADTAAAQRTIQQALAKIKAGADFGKLAAEVSADGSKNDQGYLPVGPKGQFVPAFEDAAWKLAPGQVSEVIKSQFGYHIIRRPTLAEARSRFEKYLREEAAKQNDSAYVKQLTKQAGMEVAGGAASAIRSAAFDPDGARKSSRTLVSLKGGDLTVGEFVRWLGMFPLNIRLQIRNANDSLLTEYLKNLASNVLLLRQADSANFHLSDAQWQFIMLKYGNSVSTLKRDLGLDVPELSDSSKLSQAQKATLANQKVEDYFTRLIEGRAPLQMVLPSLAAWLRGTEAGHVNQAGISRAVELASAEYRRDSAAAAARGGATARPAPGVQPAPGGPPIGGGDSGSTSK